MEPLYDSRTRLVGWYDISRGNIWSTRMQWIAWVVNGNVFSTSTHRWCGPVITTNCLDRLGQRLSRVS